MIIHPSSVCRPAKMLCLETIGKRVSTKSPTPQKQESCHMNLRLTGTSYVGWYLFIYVVMTWQRHVGTKRDTKYTKKLGTRLTPEQPLCVPSLTSFVSPYKHPPLFSFLLSVLILCHRLVLPTHLYSLFCFELFLSVFLSPSLSND